MVAGFGPYQNNMYIRKDKQFIGSWLLRRLVAQSPARPWAAGQANIMLLSVHRLEMVKLTTSVVAMLMTTLHMCRPSLREACCVAVQQFKQEG